MLKQSRGNPINPTAPKKFYPSVQSAGRITLRELSKTISKASTIHRADVVAVLEALLDLIPEELAKGHVVDLGEFGSFWLRTSGEGQETATEVRANHIKTVMPRFNPGKEFRSVLKGITFAKVNSVSPAPGVYVNPESPVLAVPPSSPPSPGEPPQS